MFRDDFEFNDGAGASHLGPGHSAPAKQPELAEPANDTEAVWTDEAARELKKIPFFVRGKARRNTEMFAAEQGVSTIELATLYEAKAHYAR
jgi:light-independent protochlorophyllide reductase subunit B